MVAEACDLENQSMSHLILIYLVMTELKPPMKAVEKARLLLITLPLAIEPQLPISRPYSVNKQNVLLVGFLLAFGA